MKFFLLDFLNWMSCKNRNGVMLVNIFLKIFSQFFKIRVECPFNGVILQRAKISVYWIDRRSRLLFLCFYSTIFKLMRAKFQTFACNLRTGRCSSMRF